MKPKLLDTLAEKIRVNHYGKSTEQIYYYHLDMLTKEDDHIAYKNPFCMSILRSFTVNLYQLFLYNHKGQT